MSLDWPDYTHGVVLSDGSVTDCPDWQEQVVGPGGVPVGGGGATYLQYTLASTTVLAVSPTNTTLLTSASLATGAYFCIGFMDCFTSTAADTAHLAIFATQTQTGNNNVIQASASLPASGTYVAITVCGVLVLNVATTLTLQAGAATHANNVSAEGSSSLIATGLTIIGPLTLI